MLRQLCSAGGDAEKMLEAARKRTRRANQSEPVSEAQRSAYVMQKLVLQAGTHFGVEHVLTPDAIMELSTTDRFVKQIVRTTRQCVDVLSQLSTEFGIVTHTGVVLQAGSEPPVHWSDVERRAPICVVRPPGRRGGHPSIPVVRLLPPADPARTGMMATLSDIWQL